MTIRSAKLDVSITWIDEPHQGRPLTRLHKDADGTHKSGDTVANRNGEIVELLGRHNAVLNQEWALVS